MIKTLNKNYKSRYFIIIFTLLLLSIKTFLLARLPTNVILFNGDTNSYLTYSENFGSLIFGANPPFAELGLIRTPGYPFFLLLLKFISLKELIFIQLVMGSAISLVTYKICKILFGERIAFLAFLFSAIEISLFYEEFYLLSDTLFAFVLVWAIYVAVIVDKRNLYNFKYALLVGLLIGISILIRPIGQVIIAAFIIFLLLHFRNLKMRNFFLVSLLAISVTISPLILRNWLVFDVVKVSSIDSVNLLYYEGANALARTSKEPLEVIQKREALLESSVLGDKPTIKEAVEYRQSRAISLIINNPFFWVESKVIGVGKLLLGISRVSSNKVLMGNGDDTEPSKFLDLSRFFALIVTIAMAIFGFIGFIRILVTRKDLGPQILLCFFAFLLLSSAGGNAYSRFRVPLNTPLAIFASIGLISIFKYIQSCFIKNNIITGFNSKFEKQVMTKIVFVYEAVFPESKGGIERWFKTLSEALAQKNFEVIYLNSQEIHGYRNGVKYVSLQGSSWTYKQGGVRSISQTLSFSLKVFNWLRRNKHDFIYGSNVPIIPIFAIGLSRFFSKCSYLVEWFEIWPIKYWIRYLGFIKGFIGWFLQFIAIQIGGYRIVYTERVLHGLKKKSFFSKAVNIKLLSGLCDSRNEIELELFNLHRNDVVFVGRFVEEKQPNLAIETIAKLVELPWTGHFWLIGSGPLQFDLVNKVKSFGLEKRITILNDAADSVVKEKMLKSFALLHPSRREGYGLAVIEAAYRGTPSVMINYPDNAAVDLEILPELVIQDDSVDSLAQILWSTHQNQAALRDKLSNWIMTASRSKSIDQSINEISLLCRKS